MTIQPETLTTRRITHLAEELRTVTRKGLPLEPGINVPRLSALASVTTEAGDDDEPDTRTDALDHVLRRVLTRLEPENFRVQAKALFGLPPGPAGATLTGRRAAAAGLAHREAHHFRKRIEPRILLTLARALLRDAAAHTGPWGSPPPVHPYTRRRPVPRDVFAWEAAEHEESLTRLWSCVYALRAELLAVERHLSMDDRQRATDAADTALWRYGQTQAEARRYRTAYGAALLRDSTAGPQDLVRLAGWTPRLPPADAALTADASTAPDTTAFLRALTIDGDTRLLTAWRTALTHTEESPK